MKNRKLASVLTKRAQRQMKSQREKKKAFQRGPILDFRQAIRYRSYFLQFYTFFYFFEHFTRLHKSTHRT